MGDVMTGVVDRFEGDQAVILLESDTEVVDEVVVDEREIPEDGRHVDAVLRVELEEEDVVRISYEAEETEERKSRVQDRFERLSERPPSDERD
ncbi:DUF3006 domain-containing protein [Halomicrococcus gelatinilyticus]|uniref:DUF3006 domain-containing protein n=1 Tax=Halomicrococcus gelatinilyticus TaxID=1702103 RepID=UPI002E0E6221